MALIVCPKCGKQISDKATICPNCGAEFIEKGMVCIECGSTIPDGVEACPICGCPVEYSKGDNDKSQTSKTKKNNKSNHKKRVVIGALFAILILGCLAIYGVSSYKTKKAEETAAQAYQESLVQYEEKLSQITDLMYSGESEATKTAEFIRDIWHNSLFEISNSKTDPYTKVGGEGNYFYDFNAAINKYHSDSSYRTSKSEILKNQKEVDELMKELSDPPEEFNNAYDSLMSLYEAYIDMTGCAVNPTGNYETYASRISRAKTDFAKYYKEMQLYF